MNEKNYQVLKYTVFAAVVQSYSIIVIEISNAWKYANKKTMNFFLFIS